MDSFQVFNRNDLIASGDCFVSFFFTVTFERQTSTSFVVFQLPSYTAMKILYGTKSIGLPRPIRFIMKFGREAFAARKCIAGFNAHVMSYSKIRNYISLSLRGSYNGGGFFTGVTPSQSYSRIV